MPRLTVSSALGVVRFHPRHGFTLVELLVAIAIIGVLVAILLPAVQAARQSAHRAQCANNLKQIALAMHLHDDHFGQLPPTWFHSRGSAGAFVKILPFLEQSGKFDEYDLSASPSSEAQEKNAELRKMRIATYLCPAMVIPREVPEPDPLCGPESGAPASYALNAGTINPWLAPEIYDGAFVPPNEKVSISLINNLDGTSNTFLIGELDYGLKNMVFLSCLSKYGQLRGGTTTWWIGYPGFSIASTIGLYNTDWVYSGSNHEWATFRSDHPAGCNFAMADGSVRFVQDTIDVNILDALATRDGKESISE